MAMHYRRHPPNPSTNPFTGRGLPTASPYRQSNDHDHSRSPSSINIMAKKATLIVLSFVVFFYLFSSGSDPELGYGNHGQFPRKEESVSPVKLTVPEVANEVKISSNEYLDKYGSGQKDEVRDQYDKREDSRDQYSYNSKGESKDASENNEYTHGHRKESDGEYHYNNEENSQDLDGKDSSFGAQHPADTASDVEKDADNFDYTADRGDSHDFSVGKSDVDADAFDYEAKEREKSYDSDKTDEASKDSRNRFESVAKKYDPKSLADGQLDSSDLVYKTADEDESSDKAVYVNKLDDKDESRDSKYVKETDGDESTFKRKEDGDEDEQSSKHGKASGEDGSSDMQNEHEKSYKDAEEPPSRKEGGTLDESEDGIVSQSLEIPISHGEDESGKKASDHSSYGHEDTKLDISQDDGDETVKETSKYDKYDESERTGKYSSDRLKDVETVESAGNSEDGLKWKQLDSKYRRSYGESDAANNDGKDSESFVRRDSYETDESAKKDDSNDTAGRLMDALAYKSADENEYHKKSSSVVDRPRSDYEEAAGSYESKTAKEAPKYDQPDVSIESDKYSKPKQEAFEEDQSLDNSRDRLKLKNLDAKYRKSVGGDKADGDGDKSSAYTTVNDSSKHDQTLGSKYRKSEGEDEARSGDYQSSVTKDEEHDSAAYEKSKYTKYGSDEEGGLTNDGDKHSVLKDGVQNSTDHDEKSEGYEHLKSNEEGEASNDSYKTSLKVPKGSKYDRSAGGGETKVSSDEQRTAKDDKSGKETVSDREESSTLKDEGRVSTKYDEPKGSKYRKSDYGDESKKDAEDIGSLKAESKYAKSGGQQEKDGDRSSGSKVKESAIAGEAAEDGSDEEPSDKVKSDTHSDPDRTKPEEFDSAEGEAISSAQDETVHEESDDEHKPGDAKDSDRAYKKSYKIKGRKGDSPRSEKPRGDMYAEKSEVDNELGSDGIVPKKSKPREDAEAATDSQDASVKESGDAERTSGEHEKASANKAPNSDDNEHPETTYKMYRDGDHEKSNVLADKDEAAVTEESATKGKDLHPSKKQKSPQNATIVEESLPEHDETTVKKSGEHDETAAEDAVEALKTKSSYGKGYIRGSASKEAFQSESLNSEDESVVEVLDGVAGLRGSKKSITNDIDSEDANASMDEKGKGLDLAVAVDESDGVSLVEERKAKEADSSDGQKVDSIEDEKETKLAGNEDNEVNGSADEADEQVEDGKNGASDINEEKADADEEQKVEAAEMLQTPEVHSGDESKNDHQISSSKKVAKAAVLLESGTVPHDAVDRPASSDASLDGAELASEKEVD